MVFILDGCSFHLAHEWWNQGLFPKENRIWRLFRSTQMPSTNRNALFTPCVRIWNEQPSNIKTMSWTNRIVVPWGFVAEEEEKVPWHLSRPCSNYKNMLEKKTDFVLQQKTLFIYIILTLGWLLMTSVNKYREKKNWF